MTQDQMQQEISIIKNVIEKTRAEAADSGLLFMFIGIGCIAYVLIIMFMQYIRSDLVLPVMIGLSVIFGIIGFLIFNRKEKKEKVKSYPKNVAHTIVVTCCLPGILTGFVFPLTNVYPFHISPIFMAIFFGIMQFSISVVYEIRYLLWAGLASWAGACVMAYSHGWIGGLTMIIILIIGFVIPGFMLNKQYKNRREEHGA